MSCLSMGRCKSLGCFSLGQLVIFINLFLIATCPALTQTTTAIETNEAVDPAEQYCKDKGGSVIERYPAYNTFSTQLYNDPRRLVLAGSRKYCSFRYFYATESAEIALDTLYASQPTLAVLAYLKPKPMQRFFNEAPDKSYCNKMGGTDRWLAALAWQGNGGTWMWKKPSSPDPIMGGPPYEMGMCVFPDLSAIDTQTLFDKSQGIIDGTDFGKIARYQPTQLPPIFNSPTTQTAEAERGTDSASIPTAVEMAAIIEQADPAEQYCKDWGGYLLERKPYYGVSNPDSAKWLGLAGSLKTCSLVLPSGKVFEIALNTLYATEPTLAIIDYYDPKSPPTGNSNSNPATDYCQSIGGTTRWGGIDEAGGWVRIPLVGPISMILPVVSSMCVFPDLSAIEENALRNRAAGAFTIADLAFISIVLRYVYFPPVQAGASQRPWRPFNP